MGRGPAFVVCPGPTLPVDSLGLLDGQLTVAVNRALLVPAWDPVVFMWTDGSMWPRIGEHIQKSTAVKITTEQCAHAGQWSAGDPMEEKYAAAHPDHWMLKQSTALAAWPVRDVPPGYAYLCANVGAVAARWLLGAGWAPVYMLGFSTRADQDREAYFYGAREEGHKINLDRTLRAAEQLMKHWGCHCKVASADTLVDAEMAPPRSRKSLQAEVAGVLMDAGVRQWHPGA